MALSSILFSSETCGLTWRHTNASHQISCLEAKSVTSFECTPGLGVTGHEMLQKKRESGETFRLQVRLTTNASLRAARKTQGFNCVKMNATEDIGWLDSPSSLDSCVERVAAVKSLGMDAGVDFHGRVHKPMAKQLVKLLEPHRPLFIEEPLLSEHVSGIKALAEQTNIPIALGERLYSRWDVKPFLEAGCVDILQPDISHCGGISEMKRIAAMAEAYDVALAPHCPLGPIALAANCQVDLSCANFAIQEMSLGIHYNAGAQDLTSYTKNPEVWTVKDGYIDILTGPGLGIEVDEEQVRSLSQTAKAWVSPGFIGPGGEIREW